jgi:2-polyprenyl-3-methyl-5-hydroxy-6-metoxy-1,4-benzoquinol methylase
MENTIVHRVCPVCGSNAVSRALEAKDHTVSKQIFKIWSCQDCSFRFTQSVPSAEAIGKYYKSDTYVSHSNTKKGLINRLYHAVRKRTLQQKLRLVRQATGQMEGNLLDIGAGTGAFASVMQGAGWKVTGLEPDRDARDNAARDYQIKLEDLSHLFELPADHYDAVTLWHVLEHVHQLHEYLETFKKILTQDGALIIAVPNFTSDDAKYYGRDWAAWDVPRHLWHFSPKSMDVLVKKHGLTVAKTLPMKFDSYYVSMLSEGYRNGTTNLFRAFWEGFTSNRRAEGDPKKYSYVIYIIKKIS